MRHLLTEQSVDYQLPIWLEQFYFKMSMNIHIIKKLNRFD